MVRGDPLQKRLDLNAKFLRLPAEFDVVVEDLPLFIESQVMNVDDNLALLISGNAPSLRSLRARL